MKISKKKIVIAIELFESKIDDTIENIHIFDSNNYQIKTWNKEYSVDLSTNDVLEVMSDVWDD